MMTFNLRDPDLSVASRIRLVLYSDKFIVKVGYSGKNLVKEFIDITPNPAVGESEIMTDFNWEHGT